MYLQDLLEFRENAIEMAERLDELTKGQTEQSTHSCLLESMSNARRYRGMRSGNDHATY